MSNTGSDLPAPSVLADNLRAAFAACGQAGGKAWTPSVRVLPASGPSPGNPGAAVLRVNLSRADAARLARTLQLMADGAVLPGAVAVDRLDTVAVSELIHVAPSTIRSWVCRNLPRGNPFPAPQKYRGRNVWDKTAIDEWLIRHHGTAE